MPEICLLCSKYMPNLTNSSRKNNVSKNYNKFLARIVCIRGHLRYPYLKLTNVITETGALAVSCFSRRETTISYNIIDNWHAPLIGEAILIITCSIFIPLKTGWLKAWRPRITHKLSGIQLYFSCSPLLWSIGHYPHRCRFQWNCAAQFHYQQIVSQNVSNRVLISRSKIVF